MSFKTSETTVGSAVATSGTITFSYPENMNAGNFAAFGHKLWVSKFQRVLTSPTDFTVSFGASNISVTYLGSTTIPAGTRVNAQFNILGADNGNLNIVPALDDAARIALVELNLGAPDVADADGICASQAGTAATAMTIAGALASGGVATFDVPRNVVGAWTNTATLTVTGTDIYGVALTETSGSGTTMAGKKAFKTITSVVPSANITGATVGSGDVLGLPVFLPGTAHVLKELQDGAAPTAGTVVAGVSTAASATTGDVRGTYDPNAACDGAKVFKLIVALGDPGYKGVTQA